MELSLFAPSAHAGVFDDRHNEIATRPLMFNIPEKPNGQGGGESNGRGYDLKRHWQPWEDLKLRELVGFYGPKNWNIVSEHLRGRSGEVFLNGKSCRLRWVNQLDPKIKKTKFSKEEDDMLMAAHMAFGNHWSQIAKFFPGRTDNGIKNHWHVLTGKRKKNVAGVCTSSSSSSGSFQVHVSGDSTNGSSGSTITLMGKSIVLTGGERTSLPCMNTPSSVVNKEEINTGLAAVDVGNGSYFNNAMEERGGDTTDARTFIPTKSDLFVFNPIEKSTSTASTTTIAYREPPKFFNFLGVNE